VHKTYSLTGTVCTGAAAKIPGTLVYEVARPESRERIMTLIGHPAGVIDVEAAVDLSGNSPALVRACVGRTARRIMEGYVFVPWRVYSAAE
jgi:2-methylaconitate cis-trans-isomerase PrpF